MSDTSDDGDDTDGNTTDDKTVVEITPLPEIEVTKTATVTDNNNNGLVDLADTVVYTITVENKGNVVVSGVTLADTLTDGNGGALTLTSGPSFTSASAGSAQGTITFGETATYSATYVIDNSTYNSGSISNSVFVTSSSPGKTNDVTDTSDDGDDTDGNTTNDPTIVEISSTPGIEATKNVTITDNGDGVVGKGDIVRYDISIENTGNISLSNLSINDLFRDNSGANLSLLNPGLTFSGSNLGSPAGTIKASETANYIGFYIIEQSAVDAGGFTNQVLVSARTPGG